MVIGSHSTPYGSQRDHSHDHAYDHPSIVDHPSLRSANSTPGSNGTHPMAVWCRCAAPHSGTLVAGLQVLSALTGADAASSVAPMIPRGQPLLLRTPAAPESLMGHRRQTHPATHRRLPRCCPRRTLQVAPSPAPGEEAEHTRRQNLGADASARCSGEAARGLARRRDHLAGDSPGRRILGRTAHRHPSSYSATVLMFTIVQATPLTDVIPPSTQRTAKRIGRKSFALPPPCANTNIMRVRYNDMLHTKGETRCEGRQGGPRAGSRLGRNGKTEKTRKDEKLEPAPRGPSAGPRGPRDRCSRVFSGDVRALNLPL